MLKYDDMHRTKFRTIQRKIIQTSMLPNEDNFSLYFNGSLTEHEGQMIGELLPYLEAR